MSKRKKIGLAILAIVFALICMVAFSGCKTVQVVTEVHDSIQVRTEVRVDSVWRDRVRVEKIAGDTVKILDSVIVEKYRIVEKADTLRVCDSIPYAVEVQVPVKVRSGYDKFCSCAFWIIIALVLLFVAWKLFKKFYLHK